METKPWYLSKTIWSDIITGLVGIVVAVHPAILSSPYVGAILAFLGALGLYGRVTAVSKIGG